MITLDLLLLGVIATITGIAVGMLLAAITDARPRNLSPRLTPYPLPTGGTG